MVKSIIYVKITLFFYKKINIGYNFVKKNYGDKKIFKRYYDLFLDFHEKSN